MPVEEMYINIIILYKDPFMKVIVFGDMSPFVLVEFHGCFVVCYSYLYGIKWRPYVSLKVYELSVRLDISLRIEHREGLKCHKMSIRLNSKTGYSEAHWLNKHVLNSVIIIRDYATDALMP
jgi:hypothetical protein